MKKINSALTMITSLLISAQSAISLQANAVLVDKNSLDRYEEYYRFSDSEIIYKSLDPDNQSSDRFIIPVEEASYCPLGLDFSSYVLTESEVALMNDYLTEQYPEFQLISLGDGNEYELNYNDSYNAEERLQIGIDIYENTGICFLFLFAETIDVFDLKLLGDLDGDSTVNALDASLVLTYYSDSQTGGLDVYTDEDIQDITLLGDYDGDGTVDAIDASLVLKEYAEEQTEV